MALATSADVELALGRPAAEGESWDALLESASALAAGYLGGEPDPVHPDIVGAVAEMVVAVLTKPATTTADYQAGGYYQQREVTTVNVGVESATTTGPWLTKSIRQRLARHRMPGARRAFAIPMFDDTDGIVGIVPIDQG